MRGGNQFMEDAALACGMVGITPLAQDGELPFKRLHAFQPRLYARQLCVNHQVDVAAVGIRMLDKPQQPLDVGQ